MSEINTERPKDFNYLQSQLDKLVKEMGIAGLINFLDVFIGDSKFESRVCVFIMNSVSMHYGIPINELILQGSKINTTQRMICFHLTKTYLKYSIRKIGIIYNRKEVSVFKGIKLMDYNLEKYKTNPKIIDMKLISDYKIIEDKVIEFVKLAKTNNTING